MPKKINIESRVFSSLEKRLAAGKSLTSAQLSFVKEHQAKSATVENSDVAQGVADLARRLGVDRRTITWHRGRTGAPKSFSVAAWRRFLLAHGKGSTLDRIEDSQSPRRDTAKEQAEETALAQFHAVSNALPDAVRAALEFEGLTVPPERLDSLIFGIWLRLATAQQHTAKLQDLAGIFDPDEEGVNYPTGIIEIAARISEQNQNPQDKPQ
ncbi:MAG: hypothetical protein ACLP2Y_08915 [Limisphaerales bacterium]